jgi:hypothetical protein
MEYLTSRRARGKSPFAFAAVDLGENDLVVRIPHFDVHPDSGAGRSKAIGSGIVKLNFVIT